jgi:AmmeMemoRadiSam system protein B
MGTNVSSLKPKLRHLDVRPYSQNGQSYLLFQDPTRLSAEALLAPQPLALVLAFCDGQHDLYEMADAFQQRYGMALAVRDIKKLLDALDDAVMLENERAAQARVAALAAYRNAPFRTPALAGVAYPADRMQLWQLLQDYLEGAEEVTPLVVDWSRRTGLLSPHIDYPRGGAVYAQIWKRASLAVQEADLVVLFGTDHYGSDPFTLTRQNYATPYGVLPTAQSVVDALVQVIDQEAAFAGELRHRGEHSLELVAVWLHHMRSGAPVEIAPVLVGGFHSYIANGSGPEEDRQLAAVIEALRSATQGRRVLVVASGDLAHRGPAFQGPPVGAADKLRLRAADDELIAYMRNGDASGFYQAIKQVRDENNICGLAPVYLTLATLAESQGEQVGYAVCPADEGGTSVVTVSGMMFW